MIGYIVPIQLHKIIRNELYKIVKMTSNIIKDIGVEINHKIELV